MTTMINSITAVLVVQLAQTDFTIHFILKKCKWNQLLEYI